MALPPPLPYPGPYHPDAGPPFGTTPGALTNNNYLNQQFDNVNVMGMAIDSYGGSPYGGFNNSPYYPGSPLDFAQNYLGPNLNNITGQINQFLGTLPPPGQGAPPGYPGAAPAAAEEDEGGGWGDALKYGAGGAAIGFAVTGGNPIGAAVGGVIGGVVGFFS